MSNRISGHLQALFPLSKICSCPRGFWDASRPQSHFKNWLNPTPLPPMSNKLLFLGSFLFPLQQCCTSQHKGSVICRHCKQQPLKSFNILWVTGVCVHVHAGMRVCVCVCPCMHVCMCVHTCVHVCVCVVRACTCTCMCTCVNACKCLHCREFVSTLF